MSVKITISGPNLEFEADVSPAQAGRIVADLLSADAPTVSAPDPTHPEIDITKLDPATLNLPAPGSAIWKALELMLTQDRGVTIDDAEALGIPAGTWGSMLSPAKLRRYPALEYVLERSRTTNGKRSRTVVTLRDRAFAQRLLDHVDGGA